MAYTSAAALIRDIKQEVGRIGNRIARGVAQVAYSEMMDAHSEIMNSFYDGYTPVKSYTFYYVSPDGWVSIGKAHGYRRTYNFRSKSIVPVGVVPSGDHSFKATIQVGSAEMSDYTNSTGRVFPASAVFDMIWNEGIRGLPPGYRGHVGDVAISAAPAGISISGKPGEAMDDFVERWIVERAPEVADIIAFGS